MTVERGGGHLTIAEELSKDSAKKDYYLPQHVRLSRLMPTHVDPKTTRYYIFPKSRLFCQISVP